MKRILKNDKPRFDRTSKKAYVFMRDNKIDRLPINPTEIISKYSNWKLMTYIEFAKKHKISVSDVINMSDSKDGCAYYDEKTNGYLILYNTNSVYIYEPARIVWTLAHEIGHIVLGHLQEVDETIISRNTLSEHKYKQLETEAHFFAGAVLAPFIVLHRLNLYEPSKIRHICGLSREASEMRAVKLKKWRKSGLVGEEDVRIGHQFSNYINQKCCLNCEIGLIKKHAKFCPVCGNKLSWGEGFMYYNDGFELDSSGKAIKCPVCNNEDINKDGDYCKICGAYLINECVETACDTIAEGNARYCISCGNFTTYYHNSYLVPWDKATTIQEKEMEEDERPY